MGTCITICAGLRIHKKSHSWFEQKRNCRLENFQNSIHLAWHRHQIGSREPVRKPWFFSDQIWFLQIFRNQIGPQCYTQWIDVIFQGCSLHRDVKSGKSTWHGSCATAGVFLNLDSANFVAGELTVFDGNPLLFNFGGFPEIGALETIHWEATSSTRWKHQKTAG